MPANYLQRRQSTVSAAPQQSLAVVIALYDMQPQVPGQLAFAKVGRRCAW